MTIITNIRCFVGYPLGAIDRSIQEMICAPLKPVKAWAILIRLQCFLEITNQTIDSSNLYKEEGRSILKNFAAALYSDQFHKLNQPWEIGRNLRIVFGNLIPALPTSIDRNKWTDAFNELVGNFELVHPNNEKIEFWSGWITENQKGTVSALVLWPIYIRYGSNFARNFQILCDSWNRTRRLISLKVINLFAMFLGNYQEEICLQDKAAVEKLIKDFFKHYFTSESQLGNSLPVLNSQWSEFVNFLNSHVFGNILAKPLGVIPTPKHIVVPGLETNIGVNISGTTVKTCLLTEIPLHITDTAAKDLLFQIIRYEYNLILKWARNEVIEANKRLNYRKYIASTGIPSKIGNKGTNTGQRNRIDSANSDSLAHAAATLEFHGYKPFRNGNLVYPTPLSKTAWDLAIPSPQLLLAHASVLVALHPCITSTFLDELEMYNKNGDCVGLSHSDSGTYLVGLKRRKGPNKGEQKVLLNSETLNVIQDIMSLTEPLRDYLRSIDDDNWRLLFLSTGSMCYKPAPWASSKHAARHDSWISERLQIHTGIDAKSSADLAGRFSLKKLRCTAGLLIYIETGSVEEMSKALGHDKWNPSLLDHYLPKPIQEFFVERWIRIFQTGIICEAMKDSSLLLIASGFNNIDDLDMFLENHAIRKIPDHLINPSNSSNTQSVDINKFIFGIDTGILTILMSLNLAVEQTTIEPCGRALYWAKIGTHLIKHLETQQDQPEFAGMVTTARSRASAKYGEKFLYG